MSITINNEDKLDVSLKLKELHKMTKQYEKHSGCRTRERMVLLLGSRKTESAREKRCPRSILLLAKSLQVRREEPRTKGLTDRKRND